MMEDAAVLVEVTRGDIVESRHRGMIAVITGQGDVIARLGDIEFVTFLRSSAKPFQAIPLVASGAFAHFGLSQRELALIVGSHSGQSIHTEAVSGLLARIGLDASALKCGIHPPLDRETADRLGPEGATVLHNNCSGKHAGMLALCRFLGHDLTNYDHPDHPVQQQISKYVAQFAAIEPEAMATGEDGCGVPTFAVTIRQMALMYARLVAPLDGEWEKSVVDACAQIVKAMIEFPEMVGGTRGRLDTELMNLARGRLIAKLGAEGVYTVGVRPDAQYPHGLGIAVKIEDGDDRRVRGMVLIEVLRQLDLLDEAQLAALEGQRHRPVKNHRGETVGHIRPVFRLY